MFIILCCRLSHKVILTPLIAKQYIAIKYIPTAFDPKEYQRALKLGVVLSAYARVMFVGPGGVGKSSLLHGLMNQPLPLADSTQLADTMTVKPATKKWANAGEDSSFRWREVTDNDEIMEIVGLVHLVAKASAGQSNSSRFVNMLNTKILRTNPKESARVVSRHSKEASKHVNTRQRVVDNIPTQVIDDILTQAKENPNVQAPEKEVLMNLWDCGGQSVFLDILPAFLTPRTMFLLMYDARRSLTDKCIIRSFHRGKVIAQQEHKATVLELLLEWMASIHAMLGSCLLYTSPSPRDATLSRMPSSA